MEVVVRVGRFWETVQANIGRRRGQRGSGGRSAGAPVVGEVVGHYWSTLGKPVRKKTYVAAGQEIDVLKWRSESSGQDEVIYATSGASARAFGSHRVEFLVSLSPEEDAVEASLAALATFPLLSGSIGQGETVTLPVPLLPRSACRTYLIAQEANDVIPVLTISDGSHVEFLQVLPIHDSELELKRQYGAEWLLERIRGQRLRISDPRRKAIQHPYVVK
jgi:hypothetical protein